MKHGDSSSQPASRYVVGFDLGTTNSAATFVDTTEEPWRIRTFAIAQIVAPGQMLIFVSGNYPILGTQMLYFLDPVLTARAAVKPPTEFLALEDGQPVHQRPIDRTRNRISKPEVAPQDSDPESEVDRSFLEEYRLTKGA